MKTRIVVLLLMVCTGLALSQTRVWEKSSALVNYPAFMGTGNTERGFATGTQTLQPYTKIWVRSSASGNYPSFMGTGSTERGFAFGKLGANDRVLLVDRKSGNQIVVLDAATGDSVGRLDTTGLAAIASGTFLINDADVSSDGVIYVCNLTTNASTSAFKIYKWTSEAATPQLALTYTGTAVRFGDKFTVTGSTADNTVTIWAAGTASNRVVMFSTTDNGTTFTPTDITLSGSATGNSPAVCPNTAGTEIFVKSNGNYLKRYLVNGTLVDSISGSIIGTGSNALRYFEVNTNKYLSVYTYGTGNENVRTVDITSGLSTAVLVGATSSLGSVANGNGVGDVALRTNGDNTVNVYVLGTNNGIGAYKLNPANYGTRERMYLVGRKSGNQVFILNSATGDSVGRLDTTGLAAIASGTLGINDVDVSTDGIIYACNLTTNTSTSAFKIYRWRSETATPELALTYSGLAFRFGDKFTVTGSTANSSVALWAVGVGSTKVLKFTTADSGATFTPAEITLGGAAVGNSPAMYPNTAGTEIFVKSNGNYLKRYLADGTLVDSISGSIIGTGSNALRYFELNSKKYLAVYTYGTGNELARIADVTDGLSSAVFMGTTPSLGAVANGNGAGDVSVKANGDGTETIYVLGTNNGIGAYIFTPPSKVALPVFSPVAGTYDAPIWMKLSTTTPSAKIYYTTNGLTPDSTAGSTLFADSVLIGDSVTTVKAIAYAPGMLPSDIAVAVYRILMKVSPPVFSPAAGTYNAPIWMKLSTTTPSAKIYYTTNGATPDSTAGSTLFADSVLISDSVTTVKAIAYAPGMLPSDIVAATYRIFIIPPAEPLYTYWAKTKAAGTFPPYFSTGNYERGMAYGKVGGKDRVYVLARTGGPKIFIFDVLTGDSVGVMLPPAYITGGTFPLDFVDVSDDGVIFAGNMTLDASTDPFKVYRWNSEADSAKTVINFTSASLTGCRLGDIISVFGRASDNTLTIFAAASGKDKIVKFTTSDNGMTFTAEVLTLSNGPMGSFPNVALAPDGSLYVKSYARVLYHYAANGTVIDSVSSAVIGTDGTDIKYVERLGKKYIVVFYPNDGAPYTDERLAIVDVTNPANAYVAFASQSIGSQPNLNGTGAVDYMPLPGDNFLVFILGTNNGVAAFTNSVSVVLSKLDTLFYGTTQNLLPNPYGSGYIVGTNGYGDLGKYQRFDFKPGDKLAGFKFWFAHKGIVGNPDTVSLVVKTVALSGAPDVTIGQKTITMDKIDIAAGNTFLLDSMFTFSGPAFIGFEWSSTFNDTIALFSDKNGEGNGANRVWEKLSNGNYNDFTNGTLSWQLDIDLWIAAYYKKGTVTSVETNGVGIPQRYSLDQNYPNPFNPSTTIGFSIPERNRVSLKIYDILGRQVADLIHEDYAPGKYLVRWNAQGLATGMYFYRLQSGSFTEIRKMLLLK